MSLWCLFDFCLPYCGLLNLEVRPHDSYGLDVLHLEVWISSDLWKTSHVSMQWIFDHGWFFHLHIHWVTLNIFSVLYTYIYTILLWVSCCASGWMDATKLPPQNKSVYREILRSSWPQSLQNISVFAMGICLANATDIFSMICWVIGPKMDKKFDHIFRHVCLFTTWRWNQNRTESLKFDAIARPNLNSFW